MFPGQLWHLMPNLRGRDFQSSPFVFQRLYLRPHGNPLFCHRPNHKFTSPLQTRIFVVRNYKLLVVLLHKIYFLFSVFHVLYLPKPFQGQFLLIVVGTIAATLIIAEGTVKNPKDGAT